jgi:hypothetical protein
MVAITRAIISQRTGSFDATTYRDRYQEALRELIKAKMKGLTEDGLSANQEPESVAVPRPPGLANNYRPTVLPDPDNPVSNSYLIVIVLTAHIGYLTINFVAHSTSTV